LLQPTVLLGVISSLTRKIHTILIISDFGVTTIC
jgi:hypothetical protein